MLLQPTIEKLCAMRLPGMAEAFQQQQQDAKSAWVREHQHLFLIGPTGVGKTWLARAFAHKTCRDGYTALFLKAAELFRDLAMARADGSLAKLLDRLSRLDLLIVDDWAMAPLTEAERRDFLEICD